MEPWDEYIGSIFAPVFSSTRRDFKIFSVVYYIMSINIRITITPLPEELDKFNIQVTAANKIWNVYRSTDEFITLQSTVLKDCQSIIDCSSWKDMDLHNGNEVTLQNFLNKMLANLEDRLWTTESLLSFLDNAPRKSPMAEVQMTRLTNQVCSCCMCSRCQL